MNSIHASGGAANAALLLWLGVGLAVSCASWLKLKPTGKRHWAAFVLPAIVWLMLGFVFGIIR